MLLEDIVDEELLEEEEELEDDEPPALVELDEEEELVVLLEEVPLDTLTLMTHDETSMPIIDRAIIPNNLFFIN